MIRRLATSGLVVFVMAGLVIGATAVDAAATTEAPVVTHVAPRQGAANGGTAVAITGAHFTGATVVEFGTKPARRFRVASAHVILATTPAGTGTVDVTVTTPSGTSATGKKDRFTYKEQLPIVNTVTPRHGKPKGGTEVTVIGKNLGGATSVLFGTVPGTNVHVYTQGVLTVAAPAGSGVVDVTVTTPLGTSKVTPKDQFSYKTTLPVVTHVSPHRGPSNGGTLVTIKGSNLTGATAVDFGDNAATDVTVVTDHEVTATSPAGMGTVAVTVMTSGGPSQVDTGSQFTYTNVAPVVRHVAPRHGPSAGGTLVGIAGSNFNGATAVDFGSTAAKSFRVLSHNVILARAPGGTGSVDVTVTTPLGTSPVTAKDTFTYR